MEIPGRGGNRAKAHRLALLAQPAAWMGRITPYQKRAGGERIRSDLVPNGPPCNLRPGARSGAAPMARQGAHLELLGHAAAASGFDDEGAAVGPPEHRPGGRFGLGY